jgi:hypothetical protein
MGFGVVVNRDKNEVHLLKTGLILCGGVPILKV